MTGLPASGSHGPGYFRYTAHAMSEHLTNVIQARSLVERTVPKRLFQAARDFLTAALNAEATEGSRDPSAGIANYRIAAHAMRGSNPALNGRLDMAGSLKEHLLHLGILSEKRPLADEEIRSLENLRTFFVALFRAAEAETYSSTIDELDERPQTFPAHE